MGSRRIASRVFSIFAVIALLAAACSKSSTTSSGSGGGASTAPHKGGSIIFGAEQWADCLNPILSCGSASWAYYTVFEQVLPRAMYVDLEGNFVASPLLTETPTTDNGGIVVQGKKFTVTFHIEPKAVWSDGTPITSEDFDFTWKAIMNTTGSLSKAGYDEITSIDTSDPQTVVIEFASIYADWWDLFGGITGYVLEQAAFPDADPSKPDLQNEMKEMISFSAGPWILKSWTKEEAVLTRNDKYWGTQALLDQVTFVPREDINTEVQSLLNGEVDVIYPQPSNVSLLDQFAANPNVEAVGGGSTFVDALWLNLASPPLDDLKVRQALAYAIDRQSVVDNIIKLNNPSAEVLNCMGQWIPGMGPWCDNTQFAKYTYDPAQSVKILESDGYDCSAAPDGPCTKDGQPLEIDYYSNAGNTRRDDTKQLVKEAAIPAGFQLNLKTVASGPYFGKVLPQGQFQMADYAGGAVDPTVTFEFACKYFPTEANNWSGYNWDRWCNPEADKVMYASDKELDVTKRAELIHQVGAFTAQDIPAIPMYVLPSVTAWRSDHVAGPIGDYNASIYGPVFNMNEWYTVG